MVMKKGASYGQHKKSTEATKTTNAETMEETKRIVVRFKTAKGDLTGPSVALPTDASPAHLDLLLNQLLLAAAESRKKERHAVARPKGGAEIADEEEEEYEEQMFSYYADDLEIQTSISADLKDLLQSKGTEQVLDITYTPQSLFRVKAVTRCSSTLSGHEEAVLVVSFSPDGTQLVSGSGDSTVRFWDLNTETPKFSSNNDSNNVPGNDTSSTPRHKSWVLCAAWSPDGHWVATGGMDNLVIIWDGASGKVVGKPLQGHTKWITSVAWQPLHVTEKTSFVASASKDHTIKIWNPIASHCLFTLAQHTDAITCLRWSGENLLFTGSRDRTIRVWHPTEGKFLGALQGHAHWVNTMALSSDYVLRTGAFDPASLAKQVSLHLPTLSTSSPAESLRAAAQKFYRSFIEKNGKERLISGSDDFTLLLWPAAAMINDSTLDIKSARDTLAKMKPITRMTGHQALINQVCFSPDGNWIASASFDKSVKLWNGHNGKFVAAFRGHVGPIYQVAWSADCRYIVSGSKDSTLKLWDMKTKKLKGSLPGHMDEVYSVDWSPDGERVASGSKDKTMKLWRL